MHLYCTRINKHANENKRAETAFKSSSFLFPGITLSLMYVLITHLNCLVYMGFFFFFKIRSLNFTILFSGNGNHTAFLSQELSVFVQLHKDSSAFHSL